MDEPRISRTEWRTLRAEVAARRAENQALRAENAALRAENQALRTRVTELEAQLAAARKSSANSSKPPSSDIAKPAPQRPRSKRKRGAQPGRKRHERQPFPPEQIDGVQDHTLEFSGVLGCDYFSAYRKYMRLNENVLVQFCLAHLIRDVKFLAEHPQAQNRASGQRLLAQLRELFAIIHRQDEYASEEAFQGALEDQGYELWTAAVSRTPKTREAQNLAERFHQHGAEYIRFLTTPGVEPTNNRAEQAIRFVVRGPPRDPRHAQPSRPHLVRTHRDRHRHLHAARPQRLPLLAPRSARPLRQHPAPLPAAHTAITAPPSTGVEGYCRQMWSMCWAPKIRNRPRRSCWIDWREQALTVNPARPVRAGWASLRRGPSRSQNL